MKIALNLLRSALFVLAALFTLASCSKKSDEINPDAGAELEGTYTVSKIRVVATGQEGTVPAGNVIAIEVTRVSETEVDLLVAQSSNGQLTGSSTVEGIELRRSGRSVNLFDAAGNQQGTYQDGTLELTVRQPSGVVVTLVGKK